MSLLSVDFLIFAVIVAVLYFILPATGQWILLLIASGVYLYRCSAWYQIANLVIFLLINYIMSFVISRQNGKPRKVAYVCVLIFDVLYLLFFKYFSFFIPLFEAIGIDKILVYTVKTYLTEFSPMGISYIALIIIGYMTDLYWEKITIQKNPGKYALFACFFPQIISGPLVKYSECENNYFGEKKHFSYDRVIRGIERILFGVFKKLVISERAAVIANTIYGSYEAYAGFYIPVAVTFYIVQLYTDFSGLMDIVIGLAEVFGIVLPENFDTPFYSESMSEFWRRWHITLGRFLKDYVLIPLQSSKFTRKFRRFYKSKVSKSFEKKFNIPRYTNMLISWIIIGFWHGGGWNYIFGVGLYMWIVIILGEVLTPVFAKINQLLHINTECFSWHLFRRIRTFILYMYGVSFFRASDIKEGFAIWKSAFSLFNPWIFFDKSMYSLGLDKDEFIILIIGIIVLFVVSHLKQKGSVRDILKEQNFIFRIAIFVILFVLTISWGYYGTGFTSSNFIYGRF